MYLSFNNSVMTKFYHIRQDKSRMNTPAISLINYH